MEIDFVVTWLDSSDVKWQEDYKKYKEEYSRMTDTSTARFRDWNLFRYWFRAVEKYAPWVNKVFLVTNGKFPDWINKNCPKLVLVKHSDYIPSDFLPTFNSHTIEFFMHRIKGLSEHFVYFNDDCYLNNFVTPDYYFKHGLPCDENEETVYNIPKYSPVNKFNLKIGKLMNVGVINAHFDRRDAIKHSMYRWFGFHHGIVDLIMGIIISAYPRGLFAGFRDRHFEQPYLKTIFDDVWNKEPELLKEACSKFRGEATVTVYLFRYWQFASNKFYPVRLRNGRKYTLLPLYMPRILKAMNNPNIWSLCLNDTASCSEADFQKCQQEVENAFRMKFPEKSSFEK